MPGIYTVESAPLLVDGRRLEPGETIDMERGTHTVSAPSRPARLVWGNNIVPPEEEWDYGPLYVGF